MQALADKAGVKKDIVDAMSVSMAVRRVQALKVLAALSEYTGESWTLDNVQVRLLPTYSDYHAFHPFDLARLSTGSTVPFDRLEMLLRGEPITTREAQLVLLAASRQIGLSYKLANVDMALSDEEGADDVKSRRMYQDG